ncbi:precorrin-6Y methyltransferase [Tateyamaria omphalii]|uniref:precorrin-6y C5,15-methyltransferase (decarboxylating) subunit CbiE n=1 Tax=Tateyamaria omphalii TaxID=299262 RepID=UPI0016768718|nr:precorrin-6y C5,15-methyltransferase (decarboxylating) subunit CbiE [Tateyamaria omphalii]GGX49827.1 precorrin-6Y methyltransferase [Tateyamaria omphalii]
MSDPWLTIIGIGEDGVAGLSAASQAALSKAEVIMGPQRHLDLVVNNPLSTSVPAGTDLIPWPVPFADGIAILASLRGQRVAVLASGDPFWFGAGSTIARSFGRDEWTALPGPSSFTCAANRLGWALEHVICLGLHAAPFARICKHLAPAQQLLVTVRDGAAVLELARYLTELDLGRSDVHVMERLGGPLERVSSYRAESIAGTFEHPVLVGLYIAGNGPVLTTATGQSDDTFDHDGQITKRPIRAITLSTLAPRPGEHLWDVGAGSGSVALEWLLSAPMSTATCFEIRRDRADRIRANAAKLGVENALRVIEAPIPDVPENSGITPPDAVFIGGGLTSETLDRAVGTLARIVVNAVTLEGEALLAQAHAKHGGSLTRIALSHAAPLGPKRGWQSSYPVVQWSLEQ